MSGWVNALTEQALVNWVQSLEPTKLPFDLHMHIEVLRAHITLIIKIKSKSKLHSLSVCWGHPLTPFPKQKEEKKKKSVLTVSSTKHRYETVGWKKGSINHPLAPPPTPAGWLFTSPGWSCLLYATNDDKEDRTRCEMKAVWLTTLWESQKEKRGMQQLYCLLTWLIVTLTP